MWNIDISPSLFEGSSVTGGARGRGVGAHCWGSEESDRLVPPLSGYGRPGGLGSGASAPCVLEETWERPGSSSSTGGGWGSGVGLLFEIWIVDASIL